MESRGSLKKRRTDPFPRRPRVSTSSLGNTTFRLELFRRDGSTASVFSDQGPLRIADTSGNGLVPPVAASTIATMRDLVASGRNGHRSTTNTTSASVTDIAASTAPDRAPPSSEMATFPTASRDSSSPLGGRPVRWLGSLEQHLAFVL